MPELHTKVQRSSFVRASSTTLRLFYFCVDFPDQTTGKLFSLKRLELQFNPQARTLCQELLTRIFFKSTFYCARDNFSPERNIFSSKNFGSQAPKEEVEIFQSFPTLLSDLQHAKRFGVAITQKLGNSFFRRAPFLLTYNPCFQTSSINLRTNDLGILSPFESKSLCKSFSKILNCRA